MSRININQFSFWKGKYDLLIRKLATGEIIFFSITEPQKKHKIMKGFVCDKKFRATLMTFPHKLTRKILKKTTILLQSLRKGIPKRIQFTPT